MAPSASKQKRLAEKAAKKASGGDASTSTSTPAGSTNGMSFPVRLYWIGKAGWNMGQRGYAWTVCGEYLYGVSSVTLSVSVLDISLCCVS
jgi:hypothetical protein